jgi:hypothetical protein
MLGDWRKWWCIPAALKKRQRPEVMCQEFLWFFLRYGTIEDKKCYKNCGDISVPANKFYGSCMISWSLIHTQQSVVKTWFQYPITFLW